MPILSAKSWLGKRMTTSRTRMKKSRMWGYEFTRSVQAFTRYPSCPDLASHCCLFLEGQGRSVWARQAALATSRAQPSVRTEGCNFPKLRSWEFRDQLQRQHRQRPPIQSELLYLCKLSQPDQLLTTRRWVSLRFPLFLLVLDPDGGAIRLLSMV